MSNSDGAAARTARSSEASEIEETAMSEISETYIREQLEKRRDELNEVVATTPPTVSPAHLLALLTDVDSALQRLDDGTYGICTECHETVERDRLLADPLVTLCLDHLSSDEQRALERDLELAARVQRGLLPQTDLSHRDWRFHYQYKPAGMVSGAYCDLFFLLGDVAGMGVAASLLMTHLHAMFRSLTSVGMPLDKLLETANSVFCRSTIAGQYAPLICGRAGSHGEIEIGSAGHLAALAVGKDGVRQVTSTGVPLGMFASSRYTIQCVRMNPGDSLLLYTDGISEAVNSSGEEYGAVRLSNIASLKHGWVPQELAAACMKDVQLYAAGQKQRDDQTLMVIHRGRSIEVALDN